MKLKEYNKNIVFPSPDKEMWLGFTIHLRSLGEEDVIIGEYVFPVNDFYRHLEILSTDCLLKSL